MIAVREPIDHWSISLLSKLFQVTVGEHPRHYRVNIPVQDLGRVRYRFSSSELHLIPAKSHRVATKIAYGRFKRRSRPRGRLLEYHCNGLASKPLRRALLAG